MVQSRHAIHPRRLLPPAWCRCVVNIGFFKLCSTLQPSEINISFAHFPDIKCERYRFQRFSPLRPLYFNSAELDVEASVMAPQRQGIMRVGERKVITTKTLGLHQKHISRSRNASSRNANTSAQYNNDLTAPSSRRTTSAARMEKWSREAF